MSLVRRLLVVTLALVIAFLSTGCWDYMDVDELFVVTGMGVEMDDQGQYLAVFEMGKAQAGPEGKMSVRHPTAVGDTLFDCIRNAITKVGSKLYWGHTMVIVIHSDIAKKGIADVLDTLDRAAELRSDIIIGITNEKPVSKIFKMEDPIHESIAHHIKDLFEDMESSGKYIKMEMMQAISDISSNTGSLTLPMFHMEKEDDEDILIVEGAAAFSGDKMVGELNPTQTRSLAILKGDITKSYALTLKEQDDQPAVTVEVVESSVDIKADVQNNIPTYDIKLKIVSDIVALETTTNYIAEDRIDVIIKRYEKQIRDELMEVIDKAQIELKSDIFFFGKCVLDNYPEYWRTFDPQWNKQFVNAYFDMTIDFSIFSSGTNMEPIKVGQ